VGSDSVKLPLFIISANALKRAYSIGKISVGNSSISSPLLSFHKLCLDIKPLIRLELVFRCSTPFTNRDDNKSEAVGLSSGSSRKQSAMNSFNADEKSPSNFGGLDLGIKNSARRGSISEKGGFPVASSIIVIPRLL
jgi:hypothetical protein